MPESSKPKVKPKKVAAAPVAKPAAAQVEAPVKADAADQPAPAPAVLATPAAPVELPEAPQAPGLDAVMEAALAPVIHETIAEGKKIMATTAETTTPVFPGADKAQAFFGDVAGRAKASMEKTTRFYEELGDLAKGNVEALVASSRIAAKGAETLGQEAAAYGKTSFENATAAVRNMASVKSPTELFQLQSDYARASFDAAIAESSKVSEQLVKLAGDVFQPISTRFAVAAEKVKSAAL